MMLGKGKQKVERIGEVEEVCDAYMETQISKAQ